MLSGQIHSQKCINTICWPLRVNPAPRGLKPLYVNRHKSGRQFMTSGQNWICPMPPYLPAALEMVDKTVFRFVHHLPISTCGNAKVDKSGRFFRIFYFFFYFFSYTPIYLLLCNYSFLSKHPVLSAIMRFFHFFDPFFTLFCTFSHLFTSIQSRTIYPISLHNGEQITPKITPKTTLPRGRADTADPPILLLYFFVLTCEKDSSVSEKARIFMTAFERLKKAQDPVIRRSLSRLWP